MYYKTKTGLSLKDRIARSKKPKITSEFFRGERRILVKGSVDDIHSSKCLKRAIIVNSHEKLKNYRNVNLIDNPGETSFERYMQPTEENIFKHLKYAVRNERCRFIVLDLNNFIIKNISKFHSILCESKQTRIIILSKKYIEFLLKYKVKNGEIVTKNIYDISSSNIIAFVGNLKMLENLKDFNFLLNTDGTQINKHDLKINTLFYRPNR